MARVLVTRTAPGAASTAARLEAMGHKAVLAPALRIEMLPASPDASAFDALLFTSSNGVLAFAAASADRTRPAWCVGEATAQAATAAGFAEVHAAAGDLQRLAAAIGAATAGAGRFLHVAGADLAGDLAGLLRAQGHSVVTRAFYRAVENAALPDAVEDLLRETPPGLDAVLFHSARGAAAFAKQVKRRDALARIDALCLSAAVARAACGLTWRRVAIAGEPLDSALLALLPAAH
ncbi:MAG: uroporphyrinogen-III synthase [Hyphomonadaceae bacterium]|nr:uroporphyrinogen-III synthase [Hyphomonadaceae bacterium]